MAGFESGTELHKRLDDLDKEIRRVQSQSTLPPADQREGEALRARGQALRGKVQKAERSDWEAAKRELHAEWQDLIHSMERWATQVDRRYGKS